MDAENKLTPEEYAAKFTMHSTVTKREPLPGGWARYHFNVEISHNGMKVFSGPYFCGFDSKGICTRQPKLTDVLSCLSTEFRVLDYACFEDFCGDFGLNPDSIKDLKSYEACVQSAIRFRAVMGEKGLQELHEVFENY